MREDLLNLIIRYQETVKQLFPRVAAHLNVKLPVSDFDWAVLNTEQVGQTSDGIRYFRHGCGVTMNDGKVAVDFDLGEQGQIDGFDAGRLSRFAYSNRIRTRLRDMNVVDYEIRQAEAAGELIFSGRLLYYLRIAGPP